MPAKGSRPTITDLQFHSSPKLNNIADVFRGLLPLQSNGLVFRHPIRIEVHPKPRAGRNLDLSLRDLQRRGLALISDVGPDLFELVMLPRIRQRRHELSVVYIPQ